MNDDDDYNNSNSITIFKLNVYISVRLFSCLYFTDAVSDRLNSYHSGCKAHSVLLLCQVRAAACCRV